MLFKIENKWLLLHFFPLWQGCYVMLRHSLYCAIVNLSCCSVSEIWQRIKYVVNIKLCIDAIIQFQICPQWLNVKKQNRQVNLALFIMCCNFFISMQDEVEIEFSHVYVTLCILNTWSFGTCVTPWNFQFQDVNRKNN
jgi:hypothetical protein